ncbi:hypothetical protein K493DRAFT_315533 [Basidiobolus meristosporus CBS 931.73]|uniref:Uncharacterized protein n=1 Tax=Basidiobolus meristosporus CBS 931.73 TaxID=1314790 RepID=A0A1Y1Y8J3_9FUNG|nr:hypothetical protein K493DRAFT_315533 [Basidiobolus meristosporus CBS 931.73]|eukprot:ORX94341.1 hypothetical protein K493DRAFT_315533 [Basidiobolus meristosporus CBS 931.73]
MCNLHQSLLLLARRLALSFGEVPLTTDIAPIKHANGAYLQLEYSDISGCRKQYILVGGIYTVSCRSDTVSRVVAVAEVN